MTIRVDHSGPEPVLVVGEDRVTMAELREMAADLPDWVRDRVEASCTGQEFAHALIAGGLCDD